MLTCVNSIFTEITPGANISVSEASILIAEAINMSIIPKCAIRFLTVPYGKVRIYGTSEEEIQEELQDWIDSEYIFNKEETDSLKKIYFETKIITELFPDGGTLEQLANQIWSAKVLGRIPADAEVKLNMPDGRTILVNGNSVEQIYDSIIKKS